ncbi:gamma-glutamyl-gamma-aminobutyrate hydrolase family protein, partial [Klebsiella pneumoniae]|nr:gamma-glutamyl-gamma-aminobutyrate hydrolase family protein [Klebsiella pneumoniae]MCP6594773.1 gamma-glutamyl-gamma-aminobutyrate hydrolase family protein [Klebsiella pneumoniae]
IWLIFSGGPASVYAPGAPRPPAGWQQLGIPVLGICYGMQTMAVQLGGKVEWSDHREFGYAEMRAHGHTRLLDGIEDFT